MSLPSDDTFHCKRIKVFLLYKSINSKIKFSIYFSICWFWCLVSIYNVPKFKKVKSGIDKVQDVTAKTISNNGDL